MWEAIAKVAVFLCLVLAWQTFSKTREAEELRVELSWTRYEADRLKTRLSEADEAVKAAEEARQRMYDDARRILGTEPPERDGAVAPALKDVIERLP